jgi:hypothetical protein
MGGGWVVDGGWWLGWGCGVVEHVVGVERVRRVDGVDGADAVEGVEDVEGVEGVEWEDRSAGRVGGGLNVAEPGLGVHESPSSRVHVPVYSHVGMGGALVVRPLLVRISRLSGCLEPGRLAAGLGASASG